MRLLARLRLGDEPVEQLVLIALQLRALGLDLAPVPAHRLGVPPGLAPLTVSERARERLVERERLRRIIERTS